MRVDVRYLGRSELRSTAGGSSALALSPNLARPRVFYDAEIRHPVRFREGISALHEVVIGDLRIQKRDRSAHEAWKKSEAERERALRDSAFDQTRQAELGRLASETPPADLEKQFRQLHRQYWNARTRWASELSRHDPELFRHLVPCDPVVTVAPDVVFFEGFSKDQSSYGCLNVDREAFEGESAAGTGTTNVDYSVALYQHFQSLRSYRPTRLLVDPTGFEVRVETHADYREEKIDLPEGWLRGFSQLQAAMTLPSHRVPLSVDVLYSLLAFLRRHREKSGPRSLRFLLTPGRAPQLAIEPWGQLLQSRGPAYQGERPCEIKVWGRRRLMVLARLLPLVDRVEVRLLGSGLPSVWVLWMGEMRFTLALSGWTQNDWAGGASLELLAGEARPDPGLAMRLLSQLGQGHRATVSQLDTGGAATAVVMRSLHQLARQGQVIYDFAGDLYRYRPVLQEPLTDTLLGPEPEEQREGRALFARRAVILQRDEVVGPGRRLLVGRADHVTCEAIQDADGALGRARCGCSFFHRFRLRQGPCRHLLALRLLAAS